jgi:hypothetical protein
MFYTKPPVEFAERTRNLREALKAACSLKFKIAELRALLQDLMASVKGGHGVRPAGTILHPASQETVWFDTAAHIPPACLTSRLR